MENYNNITYYCVSNSHLERRFDTLEKAQVMYNLLCARDVTDCITLRKITEDNTIYSARCIAVRYGTNLADD